MIFVELKSLAGSNYVRAADVIAVQYTDPTRCAVMMQGGVTLPCVEPAKSVVEKLERALGAINAPSSPDTSSS